MLYNITWYLLYNITWHLFYNITWHILYNISWHMLYNITWHLLFNITWHMLYNITYFMLYNLTWHMFYNMFCSVTTSSLADIQALVFLWIHAQNVNWITTAQINSRREKMQIRFYINQIHLWNNSVLRKDRVFFLFYSVHVSLFVYLFSFICIYLF